MQYIIFDLEATCWDGHLLGRQQEIIEIGAVRLNAFGEPVSRFQRFVRPVLNPVLSPYCKWLTGIEQDDVVRANPFERVIDDFQLWIEEEPEPYLLCAWGDKDYTLLEQDCALHNVSTDWLEQYIDIKAQYHAMKQHNGKSGLRKTLQIEGFEFTGDHHRALPDAQNLSKLFVKYLDEWQY